MLERPATGVVVRFLLPHHDGQHAEEVASGAHRHDVEGSRWPARSQADLAGAGAEQVLRQVHTRRHAFDAVPGSTNAETVSGVERGPATREGAHRLQDRWNPGPVQGQPGEPLVNVVRDADLGQLQLQPPLQLAPLQDPGHLAGDGAKEVHVGGAEAALLDALHVDHAHQAGACLDRH